MLDTNLRDQLRGHFTNLTHPVVCTSHTDDDTTGQQMVELLDELATLSPHITHRRDDTNTARRPVRTPSFTIARADDPGIAVTFAGLPLGHEFTSLVLAVLHVGGHPIREPEELLERARRLTGPLHFETYFSQTCQNCPDVVQALNVLAVVNPNVTHVAIDGATFPQEVQDNNILTVPTVYCNGTVFGHGRMTLDHIVTELETRAGTTHEAGAADTTPYDVLVIGGGPAGVTAAVYASRKGLRTGLVTDRIGGQVLDTAGIDNLIAVLHTEGADLARTLERNIANHPVAVMTPRRATRLSPSTTPDGLHTVELDNRTEVTGRTVILAPGARWRTLDVSGEQDYRNRGVTFCPHCDGPLFAGKRVAVIGGGNSGAEAALDLSGIVEHVTVIEYATQLRADHVLQQALKARTNIDVTTGAETTQVVGDGTKVTGVTYTDRATGQVRTVHVDGVFIQIGLIPNTDWLDGVVEKNSRGEIVIDSHGATNIPGVFAAGDATTGPHKQIVTAMGDGANASIAAFDHLIRQPDPPQ